MAIVQSATSAAELRSWRKRHRHSLNSGAWALGLTRSHFAKMLAGTTPIDVRIELLMWWNDRYPKLYAVEAYRKALAQMTDVAAE